MTRAASNVAVTLTLKGQDRASRAINKVGLSSSKMGRQVGRAMRQVAGLAGGLTVATTAAKVFSESLDFSKELGKLSTMLPGQTKRVQELGEAMRKLSRETGVARSDLAQGAFQVISAFGDSADAVRKLQIVTQAAKAGGADTASSLALLSSVTKAYGDTSAEALRKVSDLAFMTNKLGQTTFPELAQSMGKVAPLAAQLGVSQQELFAVFSTLTGVTGDAAAVSTQLASIMASLLKESTGASKAIKELGNGSARAAIESLGFVGALRAMTDRAGTSAEAMQELFKRKEAVLGALPLLTSQADVFAGKLAKMADHAGATAEAQEAIRSGAGALGFEWDRLIATAQDLALEFSQGGAGGALLDFVRWLRELIEEMRTAIRVVSSLAKAISGTLGGAFVTTMEASAASVAMWSQVLKGNFSGVKTQAELLERSLTKRFKGIASDWSKLGDAMSGKGPEAFDMLAGIRGRPQREQRRRPHGFRFNAAALLPKKDKKPPKKPTADQLAEQKWLNDTGFDFEGGMDLSEMQKANSAAFKKNEKGLKKEIEMRRALTSEIIRGAGAVAGALIENEKALAPIKLAMALGEAAIAFLRAKTPVEKASAIAAGAVAVAQFGKVMSGGAGGAGASLPSPGGGAGPGMVGAGASGQSAPTVVVNFGQGVVLGTPAEIARSIKGTFAAAHNTGF